MINKLLIVGCGLIGSSILKKVLKKKNCKKNLCLREIKKKPKNLKKI